MHIINLDKDLVMPPTYSEKKNKATGTIFENEINSPIIPGRYLFSILFPTEKDPVQEYINMI